MFPGPQLSRVRRQAGGGNTVANCDFGSGQSVDTCGWENLDNLTRWVSSNIYTISSNIYTISSNIYPIPSNIYTISTMFLTLSVSAGLPARVTTRSGSGVRDTTTTTPTHCR